MTTSPLDAIRDLLFRGQNATALELATQAYGAPRQWNAPGLRSVLGRLAVRVGLHRYGVALDLCARRDLALDPHAYAIYLQGLEDSRGPWPAWRFFRAHREVPLPAVARARFLSTGAAVLVGFRDFQRAKELLAEAEELAPGDPWVGVDRANLHARADELDRALECARQGYERHPDYPAAIGLYHEALIATGAVAAAEELLDAAVQRTQCSRVFYMKARSAEERMDRAGHRAWIERWAAALPLATDKLKISIAEQRLSAAWLAGDSAAAVALAQELLPSRPALKGFIERVEAGASPSDRKLLDVPFVRQDHMTCGPAALTAVSLSHGIQVDQRKVAHAISFHGTTSLEERRWCEDQGFAVREFRLDSKSAETLISRGFPFALQTRDHDSAHLQAVAGIDPVRETLLIRESTWAGIREVYTEALLEQQAPSGPRAMVFAPPERAAELFAIDLPEADAYDALKRLAEHLAAHRRDEAGQAFEALRAVDQDGRLTVEGGLAITRYDGDDQTELEYLDRHCTRFPKDLNMLRWRGILALRFEPKGEWLARIRGALKDRDARGILGPMLAYELLTETDAQAEIHRLLEFAHRTRPWNAQTLGYMASIAEAEARFEDAAELLRFCAHREPSNSTMLRHWLDASMEVGREEEPLTFLRGVFERALAHDSGPAERLAEALKQRGQDELAMDVLVRSRDAKPSDGVRWLLLASEQRRVGQAELARETLANASAALPVQGHRELLMELERDSGNLATALEHAQWLAAAAPMVLRHRLAVANLLAALAQNAEESRARRHEAIAEVAAQYPHWLALQRELVECAPDDDLATKRDLCEQVLQRVGEDPWTLRELAMVCTDMGREDEAKSAFERAGRRDHQSLGWFSTRAISALRFRRLEDATRIAKEGLERHGYDQYHLARVWVTATELPHERKERIRELGKQLSERISTGSGLDLFTLEAQGHLPPAEVTAMLAGLRTRFPQRSTVWRESAWWHVRVLDDCAGGRTIIDEGLRRFPSSIELALEGAELARRERRPADGVALLEAMRRRRPRDQRLINSMARLLESQNDLEGALRAYREGLRTNPRCAAFELGAADLLWSLGRLDECAECFQRAVLEEPENEDAWAKFRQFARSEDRLLAYDQALEQLKTRRGNRSMTWIIAASSASGPAEAKLRLAASRKALELDPGSIRAHDAVAYALVLGRRFDEALAHLDDPRWQGQPPLVLRGRRAFVLHERSDFAAAAEAFEALVHEEPTYSFAWDYLIAARRELGDEDATRAAIEGALANRPSDSDLLLELGRIQLQQGNVVLGLETLERAMRLAPRSVDIAGLLFDESVERRDFERAARALAAVEPYLLPRVVPMWSARLLAAQGDRQGMETALETACADPRTTEGDLRWIQKSVSESAPMRAHFDALIDRVLQQDPSKLELARHRARALVQDGALAKSLEWLERFSPDDDAFHGAAEVLLPALAKAPNRLYWRRALRRHRRAFQADGRSWGAVAQGLGLVREYKARRRWTRDHATRADADPWGLIEAAAAALDARQTQEAKALLDRIAASDDAAARSAAQLLLGALSLAEGRFDEAAESLRDTNPDHVAVLSCSSLLPLAERVLAARAGQPAAPAAELRNWLGSLLPLHGAEPHIIRLSHRLADQLRRATQDRKARQAIRLTSAMWRVLRILRLRPSTS